MGESGGEREEARHNNLLESFQIIFFPLQILLFLFSKGGPSVPKQMFFHIVKQPQPFLLPFQGQF